jgi:hypothetical protein
MSNEFPIVTLEEGLSILSQLEDIYDEKLRQLDQIQGNGPRGLRGAQYFSTLAGAYQRIRTVAEEIERLEIQIAESKREPIPVEAVTSFQIAEIAKRYNIPCSAVDPRRTVEHPKLTLTEANALLEKADALLFQKRLQLHKEKMKALPKDERTGFHGRDGFEPQYTKTGVYRKLVEIRERIANLEEQIRVQVLINNDASVSQEISSLIADLGIEA